MMTAMVMVSSEGHVMKLIATGNNVKGPAMNDAPETYVATGFEVAVKFTMAWVMRLVFTQINLMKRSMGGLIEAVEKAFRS